MSNQIFSCDQGLATANEVSGRRIPFLVTLTLTLVLLSGGLLSSGCSKSDRNDKSDGNVQGNAHAMAVFATNTAASEIISAGTFLQDLQMQGRLPGISKDDDGDVEAKKVPLSDPERYPISRTFYVKKKGDKSHSTFSYTFVRATPMSGWQLEKAWRTDSEGKTIEEFPIK